MSQKEITEMILRAYRTAEAITLAAEPDLTAIRACYYATRFVPSHFCTYARLHDAIKVALLGEEVAVVEQELMDIVVFILGGVLRYGFDSSDILNAYDTLQKLREEHEQTNLA